MFRRFTKTLSMANPPTLSERSSATTLTVEGNEPVVLRRPSGRACWSLVRFCHTDLPSEIIKLDDKTVIKL